MLLALSKTFFLFHLKSLFIYRILIFKKMEVNYDMASFNHYYRQKLKRSITYQIYNGHFNNVRAILDSDPDTDYMDVDETDEWWLDNEGYRQKSAACKIFQLNTGLF